jgi:hypothetical protein
MLLNKFLENIYKRDLVLFVLDHNSTKGIENNERAIVCLKLVTKHGLYTRERHRSIDSFFEDMPWGMYFIKKKQNTKFKYKPGYGS